MSLDMLGQVVQKLRLIPAEMLGTVRDLLEKLSGPNGRMWLTALRRFLRKEHPWAKPNVFEVNTDGRTVEGYAEKLRKRGVQIDHPACRMLKREEFLTTDGVALRLVVISGEEFEPDMCTNSNIRAEAAGRGYLEPPVEIALYIQEVIPQEELTRMGWLKLLIMHQPIPNKDEIPELLGCGPRSLLTYDGRPDARWSTKMAFVFLECQPHRFRSTRWATE